MKNCDPDKPARDLNTLRTARKAPFEIKNPCAACEVRELSICNVLSDSEIGALAEIVTELELSAHDPVMDEGEPADFLYNVTGGAVKLYKLLPDGRRQITGFLFEGDFLGIAMNDTYACSAEAVGDVRLCRFPRRKLEGLLDTFPRLEKRLLSVASNELVQAQDQMLLLGRKTAREKLCSFLLSLSRRAALRGFDASIVNVPMSRNDIGDFLGLTTETVSRTFTNLKRDGIIQQLEGGKIRIVQPDDLQDLADGA